MKKFRIKYLQSINGTCQICECELTNGGYLLFDNKDNIIKSLCPPCKDTEEEIDDLTKVKRAKLTVERFRGLLSFLFSPHYVILSSKNLLFKGRVLTHVEILKYMNDPTIDVVVKN